jgi:thiazole biosynthesis enzyme
MEKFSPVGEKAITRAIVSEFAQEFNEYVESDCIIIGGGPSGLVAGRNIARAGKKVVIIERNNYLGGGFWSGGYLMPKVTVRHPAERLLDELGVPYKMVSKGLAVCNAPHACASLIASACAAGVRVFNMTMLEDLVIKEGRVCGAVINWSPIASLPRQIAALDPVAIEARVVIDATGHDATVVKKLEQRGLIKTKGEGAMWIEKSEDVIVEYTGECFPGLIVTGMAVGTVYGLPRMGPTFGSMFLSGEAAAKIALEKMKS